MIETIVRGQVYYSDLGLKQKKRVLVVSSDEMNSHPLWDKVIVVYVTSKGSPGGPWIALSSQKGNSLANCTEILTVPKSRLKSRIGPPLSGEELREVYRGMTIALGAETTYREIYKT